MSPVEPENMISTTNFMHPEPREESEIDQKMKPSDPPFDYCYEFSETRKVLEEFFTPQEQQQFQQQKLLAFQQQSKLQQVEKVLPLDELVDFKQQSSATYIGQRLAALKQLQQKQHYEHQLQQQYENRNIIEEVIAPKSKPVLYENEIVEEDSEAQNFYSNCQTSKNFTLSPETTDYDYDSNCGDLDSEFSLKYSDLSLSNEVNGASDAGRLYSSMPVLEDGLSSGHASDTENNNPSNTEIENNMSISMSQASQRYPSGISSIQASLLNYKSQQEAENSSQNDDNVQFHLKSNEICNSRKPANEVMIHTSGLGKNNNHLSASKESLASAKENQKSQVEIDEEHDTDLETDRLLGQQRMNELQQGGFDDNKVSGKIFFANFSDKNSSLSEHSKSALC